MLDFSLVQAPFRFGVEEGVDPKQVPFGTLLTAENVVWEKSGRLQKRQGTDDLTTSIVGGGTISAAARLFTRGSELCLITGSLLYSYTGSAWRLAANSGFVPNVGIEWSTMHDGFSGVLAADVGLTSDNKLIHAWCAGDPTTRVDIPRDKVFYQISDATTGVMLTSPTVLDDTSPLSINVRVLTSGTDWIVVYSTGSGALKCVVNGNAPVTLRSDVSTSTDVAEVFDACIIGTTFVVAYCKSTGGVHLYRYSIAATPVQQATGSVSGETSTEYAGISIDGHVDDLLWVAFVDIDGGGANSVFRRCTHDPLTLAENTAPLTLQTNTADLGAVGIAVKRINATTAWIAYSYSGLQVGSEGVTRTVISTTAGSSAQRTTCGVRLLSRPFYIGSTAYLVVGNFLNSAALTGAVLNTDIVSGVPAPPGGDVYLVELGTDTTATPMPHRYVGHCDTIIGGIWQLGQHSNVVAISSGEVWACSPFISAALPGFFGWRQGTRLLKFKAGSSRPKDMWRSVTIGQETYLAAGVLTAYDGRQAFDYGFAHPAWINTAENDTAASTMDGVLATGNYIYSVVPEYISQAGVLHRGPGNVPVTIAVTGPTGSVTLGIVPVHLSQKQTITNANYTFEALPVLLAVYRSVVGGSIPQRLTVEPTYSVVKQDNAGFSSYLEDALADANISDGSPEIALSSRPAMYNEGGELDDYQPPGLLTIALYRERIFGIAGDRQSVWFSKNHASNPGVAPGFHPQLRFVLNDTLTALAVLEERLFIFSETGIYYLSGDGPAPNGDGSDYGTPNRLQTDVGCTNPRGVVSGPDGVFFVAGDSAKAEIHMLDRGMNVQWVGKPVQDLLDAYPDVTSAVLVASKNHVRFSCNNAAGTGGIVLVFDYVEKQWSHFTYAGGVAIADACMHGGVYTFVTTAGVVYKESDATWLDNGSWVTARIETAWVHAAGPLAYQAVRNFQIDGISATAHGLSVSVGFDGTSTYQQGPRAWAEGVDGVTSPGLQRAKVSINTRRKCGSIRFKVEDSAPATLGTGQGAKWSSMGIEVGVKRGLRRLPATQAK